MKFKKLFNLKKRNRRAPRVNEFMLESLEPRLLLSATPMTAAVVTTDHLDYAPGETAVITTSNQAGDGLQFAAGELVRFQVSRTDGMGDAASMTADVGPAGNEAWYVIDGIGGFTAHLGSDVSGDGVADWIAPDNDLTVNASISSTWFVEEQYRNSSLLVTAAGQESGAVATQAFTDANLNTTTVVTSSGASTYGDFVTFTATATPAVGGTTRPVGSVEFFDGLTSLGVTSSAGIGPGSSSTFAVTLSNLTAGSHSIHAVFTGGNNGVDSFNNSLSGNITQTVSQKALVGSFGADNKIYDGTTTATVLFADVTGLVGTDFVTLDGGVATYDNANVGLNKIVTLTGATLGDLGDGVAANYFLASVDTTIADVDKADATVTVAGFTGAFDGLAHGATGTVVGVDLGGAALGSSLDLGASFTNAPGGIANWVFTGGTNYNDQSGSVAIVISSIGSVGTTTAVSSSAAASTYGVAVTFTATVSAASGSAAPTGTVAFFDGATLLGTDSVADSTGVGSATWSFTTTSLTAGAHAIHAVYTATGTFSSSQSANISQTVNKAVATVTVSGFTGTYNAAAHGATGTVTGVDAGGAALGSSLNLGASFTNAPGGTATWTFLGGTNYTDQSGTAAIVINKANAVVTVNGFTGTYNAAAHGATGTVTGVDAGGAASGSSLNLGASFTNAPGGTANWVFTGGTNYNDQSGTAAIVINKANAVVTVTGFTGAFDNLPHGATGTVVGVDAGGAALGSSLNLGATFTAVPGGTANWTFTGGTNYNNQSGSVAIVISNTIVATTTTVSSSAATSTYGNAVTFTATVSAASGIPTGTVEFFDGLTSLGIDSIVDSTGVNSATFSLTLSTLTLSQLAAGGHAISAVFTGGTVGGNSFNNSTSATLTQTVNQKALVGFFGADNKQYDGTTAATILFADFGAGQLVGDDFVTLDGGSATFDNANAGLNKVVTLTGATLGDLGDGAAANYILASVDTTIADVDKADATVTVAGFTGAFDGLAHGATGTVVGVDAGGAAAGSTLDLGLQFTVAGSYIADWVFTGGINYNDQAGSVAIVITDVVLATTTTTVSSSAATSTYGNAVTFTATVSAASGIPTGTVEFFDGLTSLGIDSIVDSTGVNSATFSLTLSTLTAGSHAIHAVYTATGNFAGSQSANLTQTVNKAVATVTVSGFTGTYNAAAHGATGTVTGVDAGGAALGSSLNLGASFTNAPGGTATWTFLGGTNYTDQSGTAAIVINKANAVVTVNGFTGTYNAAAHGATGTVTGVDAGGAASGSSLNLGASFTNAPGGTANWVFTGGTNYNDQSGTAAIVINKANAVVTVTGFTGAFDNLPHGATGTVVGVDAGGAALGSSLNLGATFTAVPGGTANWTFTGGTNYNNQSGSVAIVISNTIVATTTTVSSSAATSTYGNAVTFTATVSAASGIPTGTVEFFDGLTSLGIDSIVDSTGVNSAIFSLTLSTLAAGSHATHAVFTATGNFAGSQSANLTQTVSQKSLTGNFTVANKTYDATTAAGLATQTLVGVLAGDVGNVSLSGGTASFDTANVGNNKTVTLTGATLAGTAAGNYSLASVNTTTANITAKSLTGSFTVANKTYDATTAATVQTQTLTGVIGVDVGNVILTGGTAAFVNANAGVGKTVTLTGATLAGTVAGNYSLASVNTTTANITALGLTGGFTVANKVYDSTTDAAVLTQTLTGVLGADAVTLTSGIATFDTKDAGTGKVVTLVGATLTGAASGNYSLTSVGTTTATISRLGITGDFAADNKVYDGTTDAVVLFTGLTGFFVSDDVFLDDLTGIATFANANAGLSKTVTLVGATLGGVDAGNYSLLSVGTTTANIVKADATISVTGFTGTFDNLAHGATGTVVGVDAGGVALGSSLNLGATFTVVPGGIANWVFTGGTNYTDQSGSVAIVINAVAAVGTTTTVSSSAATSTYGNAVTFTATISAASGAVAPTGTVSFFDGATLLGTDSIANSTGVGTSTWSLTTASLKAGAHAIHAVYNPTGSFTGSQSADLAQQVNQRSLTGNFTAANKVYDTLTAAAVQTRTLTGVLTGDTVNLIGGTAAFANANVGIAKTVTLTGATLSGAAAGNYSLTSVNTTTANITAKSLTGSFTVANKVYDATTAAAVQTRTLTGILAGDTVVLTGGTAAFANANVGINKTVTLTGAILTGAAQANYSLTSVNTTTANITAKSLTGSFTAANKTYDATTAATVQTRTLTGVIGAEAVSLSGGTATFSNANAGLNKTVTLNGATLSGAGAGNYSLTSVNTATATISKANALVTVTGFSGAFDNLPHGATGAVVGVDAGGAAFGSSLNLGASFTAVPGGTANWVFTGGTNYNDQSGSVAILINSVAISTTTAVSSSAATSTYGKAVTFTATVNAGSGSAAPTGTVSFFDGTTLLGTDSVVNSTGVGTSTWSLTIASLNAGAHAIHAVYNATGNFTGSQSADLAQTVNKATATITVTGYAVKYNGAAHTATGTATGVNGEDLSAGLNLSGTTHTNVGTGVYRDTVTYTDTTGNYNNVTKFVANYISRATATITVTGYAVKYNGVAHTATGTATGVNGEDLSAGLNLSGTTHTNVGPGIYHDTVTFTDTTGNYKNTTRFVKDYISRATATITVTGYAVKYNGVAHTATGTATGVNGEDLSAGLNLSGTTHTNVGPGIYHDTVTFTDTTGNYRNTTRFVKDYISKATATITVTGYAVRFDGAAHTATGTATGIGGVDLSAGLNLSNTIHTSAGTYIDTVTFIDAAGNYTNVTKLIKNFIR